MRLQITTLAFGLAVSLFAPACASVPPRTPTPDTARIELETITTPNGAELRLSVR